MTVLSISAALAAVVAVAVAFSVHVLDADRSSALVSRDSDSSWLVLTWSPSFCRAQPTNAACASGDLAGMGRTLILHGLWPQPRENQYCGVSRRVQEESSRGHRDLPPVELSAGVRDGLAATMADAPNLSLHEWYAHGTCSGLTPEAFFGQALTLATQVREAFDPLFTDDQGRQLTLSALRSRADERFGSGAGERVGMSCLNAAGEGPYVVDVRLSLPAVAAMRTVDGDLDLRRLLTQAPPLTSQCGHGLIPG
ncbi:ribonuclease T(2) [Mycolicibacterium sp. 018/SC-01/001]|uniref:ribonuclease T2 family protein n=1 Tax=Mycolicibacterium sp. 018/SC-01/001 TaxID=2592069 RepID=UPI0021062E7A|nr:ribonuclease T(2) [Mycolicibacterium sp. 018/SC-01/001]